MIRIGEMLAIELSDVDHADQLSLCGRPGQTPAAPRSQ